MKRIPEEIGLKWLQAEIIDCISPALELPWILDIDTTVKPLYGHQQGAEIGYNPQKPGRPSHIYHSYFVANLRISLGVEVLPGKKSAASQGMAGLWQTLEALTRSRWPTFGRGDCGYGSETVIREFEERQLPYLFKLRHTPKVKVLVNDCMRARHLVARLRRRLASHGSEHQSQWLDEETSRRVSTRSPGKGACGQASASPP